MPDHARRTDLLRERIKGRRAISDTGTTGALAEVVAASAGTLEDGASIAALEDFERRGVGLYRGGVALVDPSTRAFFETVLLPAQQRTYDLCRSLRGCIGNLPWSPGRTKADATSRDVPIALRPRAPAPSN